MSHILMVGAAGHGHVNPNLPVIAELVARGHRVEYSLPARFADAVASTGATHVVLSSVLPDETRGEQWPEGMTGAALFLDEARHTLPQLERTYEHDRPDVLLADPGGFAARVLAMRWGLPLVQLAPTFVEWDGIEDDIPEITAMHGSPEGREYLSRFAGWLDREGIAMDPWEFTGRPPRSVVLVPRLLQPHADRVDPSVFSFVGPCLDARPSQDEWPAPEKPLVLVSLGSAYTDQPAFFRACARAFGDGDHEVVLAVGHFLDVEDLGPLPEGVSAHRWVPQWSVLRHASLFVTHAGMGGCSEGLWHGVPMIVAPRGFEPEANGAAMAAAGVARVVDFDRVRGDEGVTLLREAWAALSTPEVARSCAVASADLRSGGGAGRAADLVEAELR